MKKGTFVVFEGIYGAGRLIVDLVNQVRGELVKGGAEVYEIDSPDTGRAQLMGAQELESGWRYGMFKPDFFFELASRARVCQVTQDELAKGRIVLSKGFTLSSAVYARLKGHDWEREELNLLEARARGLASGTELTPDLTIYVDMPPAIAAEELGGKLKGLFEPMDLARQQKLYFEELAKLPKEKVRIIGAGRSADAIAEEVRAAIQAVRK